MRFANHILTLGLRWALVSRGCALTFLTLILTFSLGSHLHAQVLYGSLTGIVTDVSNAPVPGAKIEAANVGTGMASQGITDARGVFLIVDLQPGIYRVTISTAGFATVVQESVGVQANTERRVDVQLQVARVSQKITVNAPVEALQTDRSDVKTELNSTQVTSLPLGNDRNFQTLFILVPGVAPPSAVHSYAANPSQALALYVNGVSAFSDKTLIDGTIDSSYWMANNIAYVPPSEAIEAVNFVTTGFGAEQGQAAASITNITIKSGTNALHGSAFEYNTISALQSRNYFYYGPKIPKYVLNQFGISLGGPIKKDKLFFFADWERYRMSELATGVTSIPTAALRNGDFSSVSTTIYDPTTGNPDGSGRSQIGVATGAALNVIPASEISKAASTLAALIPLPNYGGTAAGIANNYQYAGDILFHRDSVDLKINYLRSDKTTFFARYSAEPTYVFDPQQLGAAGGAAQGSYSQPGNAPGLIQSAAVGGTHAFSAHLLLDANVGYTRPRLIAEGADIGINYSSIIPGTDGSNPLQGGIPNFQLSGLSTLGNSSISSPMYFIDNEGSAAANLSWVRGSHSLRFGGTYARYDLNHFQGQTLYGVRGGFSFTGAITALNGGAAPNAYNTWADFLLGLPHGLGKDYVYVYPATDRESEYALYAVDSWQVTRKLTINIGGHYELYPLAHQDHFGAVDYNPVTNMAYLGGQGGVPQDAYMSTGPGQLEPRVGFAYRLSEKTVIRAGYGMNSDPFGFMSTTSVYPIALSQQISGANSYTPGGSLSNTWTGPTTPGVTLPAGIPQYSFPNLSQGKFSLPSNNGTYTFAPAYHRGYTEAWNFTVQRDLGKDFNAQIAYVADHAVRQQVWLNANAGGPGGGNAGTPLYAEFGNASTILEGDPYTGGDYNSLQTQLTRRVAGSQLGVVYTYSKWIDDSDETGTPTWNYSPVLKRNEALSGNDRTHNLEFYAVYNSPFGHKQHWLTTGAGAAILGQWSLSPILSRMSGTPFSVTTSGSSCNCPGNTQTADQIEPKVAILGGHGPNEPYFDPMAFAAVTAVRFGTTGRDIVRGPGYFNINLSLVRDFRLTERLKLQFRAEAYGLTNTPNFANPATGVSNAKFANGAVTSYGGYDIISSTFQANGGPDRQIRFALLLRF